MHFGFFSTTVLILLNLLNDLRPVRYGNVYGLSKQKSSSSKQNHRQFLFSRKQFLFVKQFPGSRQFVSKFSQFCSNKTNRTTVIIRRIGGNYEYGPMAYLLTKNKVCNASPKLKILKKHALFSQTITVPIRQKNKIWRTYCLIYYKKRKLHTPDRNFNC